MGKTAEELRSDIAQQRIDLTRDFEMIGDRVSPARIVERRTEAAKGRVRRMREAVMGTADDVTGSAGSAMGSLRDTAGEATGRVGEVVHGAPHQIERGTRGNPLAAGMVAFGLGLLAATVLPSTRKERQLARQVQPQLEQAAEVAADAGRQVATEMQPAVQETGSELADVAKEAAGEVQQTARQRAGSVAETAKSAGHDVNDRARS